MEALTTPRGVYDGSSIGVEAAFASVSPMPAPPTPGGSSLLPSGAAGSSIAVDGASIGVEAAFAFAAPGQGGSMALIAAADRDFWGTSLGVEAAFADVKGLRQPTGTSALIAAAGPPYGGASIDVNGAFFEHSPFANGSRLGANGVSVDVNGAFAEYSPFRGGPPTGPVLPIGPFGSSATTVPAQASSSANALEQRIADEMLSTPQRLASTRRPEGGLRGPARFPFMQQPMSAMVGELTLPPQQVAPQSAPQSERQRLSDARHPQMPARAPVPTSYGFPACGPQRYPTMNSVVPAPSAPAVASPLAPVMPLAPAEFVPYAYHAPSLRYEASQKALAVQVMGPGPRSLLPSATGVAYAGSPATLYGPPAPSIYAPPASTSAAVYTAPPPQFLPYSNAPSVPAQSSGLTVVAPANGQSRSYTAPFPMPQAPGGCLGLTLPPPKAATYTPPLQVPTAPSPPPMSTYVNRNPPSQPPSYIAPARTSYVPPTTYAVPPAPGTSPAPATQFAGTNMPSYRGPSTTSPVVPWRDFRQ